MNEHAPTLGLYVHIPWCVRKCPYCDFNSHAVGSGEPPFAAYVDALLRDLDTQCEGWPRFTARPIDSIFFGGGTPSLLPAADLQRLLDGIRARLQVDAAAEVTLEANPGAVDEAGFAAFREAGVNRLSLGIQSFDDQALQRLGRIHCSDDAERAIALAQRVGFGRINLDLMHGLPGQTRQAAMDDLRRALAYGTDHLSWYQLTLEPNTVFARFPPVLPDEDRLAAIHDAGLAMLSARLHRYEVSAWSLAGSECRHNLNYWRFGDYLAIGAGAHGKLTCGPGKIGRYRRTRAPQDYLAAMSGEAVAPTLQMVPSGELALEFMMNVLRLVEGVDVDHFVARTGLPPDGLQAFRQRAVAAGLLHPHRLATTARGLDHLDTLLGWL